MKQTADSYHISGESQGFGWARVFIQEGIRDVDVRWGYIAIVSDYGLFGSFFSNTGPRPFREFLASLEFSYAMEKLRPNWKRFDLAASAKRVRKEIDESRGSGVMDKPTARKLHDAVTDALAEGRLSAEAWCIELINAFDSYWSDWAMSEWCCVELPTPDCKALWEHVWPKLLAEFRQEAEVPA